MGIPDLAAQEREGEGLIPAAAVSFPDEKEAPEVQPPIFSFRRYNKDYCQLEEGTMGPFSRSALCLIKEMGTRPPLYAPGSKHIMGDGEYAGLYRTVGDIPDAAVYEVRLSGKIRDNGRDRKSDEGRFFYYPTLDNTVYVLAIRASHLSVD